MLDRQLENQEYIIFASDLPLEQTEMVLKGMKIKHKVLKGRYKGVNEDSYIINKTDKPKIYHLVYKQESILELSKMHENGNRMATLIYKDNKRESLGYAVDVPQEEAEAGDAYTLDPSTGLYWVAKEV